MGRGLCTMRGGFGEVKIGGKKVCDALHKTVEENIRKRKKRKQKMDLGTQEEGCGSWIQTKQRGG